MTEEVVTGYVTQIVPYNGPEPGKYIMGVQLDTGRSFLMKKASKRATVYVGKWSSTDPNSSKPLTIGVQISARISKNAQGQDECFGSTAIAFGATAPAAYGGQGGKGGFNKGDSVNAMVGGLIHDTASVLAAFITKGAPADQVLTQEFAGGIFDFFHTLSESKRLALKPKDTTSQPQAMGPPPGTTQQPQQVQQQPVQQTQPPPAQAQQLPPVMQPISAAPQIQQPLQQVANSVGVGTTQPNLTDMASRVNGLITNLSQQPAPPEGY